MLNRCPLCLAQRYAVEDGCDIRTIREIVEGNDGDCVNKCVKGSGGILQFLGLGGFDPVHEQHSIQNIPQKFKAIEPVK